MQGGSTTSTSGLLFLQPSGGRTALSSWSWGHQGIFLDTDGTLINPITLPAGLGPQPGSNWSLATPGLTWHSAVESELFDPAECFYVGSGDGAVCRPELVFRRVMLNNHQPDALVFRDLLVTSETTNRTSRVHFTKYNEMGYQFTVATRRSYWMHWDTPMELNPSRVYLHKIDYLNSTHGWLALSLKWPQVCLGNQGSSQVLRQLRHWVSSLSRH
jgi:hypothetical protein